MSSLLNFLFDFTICLYSYQVLPCKTYQISVSGAFFSEALISLTVFCRGCVLIGKGPIPLGFSS